MCVAVTAATGIAATHISGAASALRPLPLMVNQNMCQQLSQQGCKSMFPTQVLVCAGTTLHSQCGCGVPRTYDDFGRMWRTALPRWRKLKAC